MAFVIIIMETDIGNPITFDPKVSDEMKPLDHAVPREEDSSHLDDVYYDQSPQTMYQQPHPVHHYPVPNDGGKFDFASLDKMTYILVFIGFILGFFMGKTQTIQPMILRYS
jgi:hypothetical protein